MAENQIGAYHLADDKTGAYEVQRSNHYEFIVFFTNDDKGSLDYAGVDYGNKTVSTYKAQETLRLSVSSASVPHFTQEVITIKRGNSSFKAAGGVEFPSGTIKFHDYVGVDTASILSSWRSKAYNVATDKVGMMTDYKYDADLVEYTPYGTPVRYWHLKGCWISGLSEDDFNSEDATARMITATIEYDRAIPETYSSEVEVA